VGKKGDEELSMWKSCAKTSLPDPPVPFLKRGGRKVLREQLRSLNEEEREGGHDEPSLPERQAVM